MSRTIVEDPSRGFIRIRIGPEVKSSRITYIFNIKTLLSRSNSVIKPAIAMNIKKILDNNVIFWINYSTISINNIDNPNEIIHKYINTLRNIFVESFTIIYATCIYSAPYVRAIKQSLTDTIVVVGKYIGCGSIVYDNTTKIIKRSNIDYAFYQNISLYYDTTKFVYLREFKQVNHLDVMIDLPFSPQVFLLAKLEKYPTLSYSLELVQTPNKEIIYIAGAPSMGKTHMAKTIAKEWKYIYVDRTTNFSLFDKQYKTGKLERSVVLDLNPTDKNSYLYKPNRIFHIFEFGATHESAMLISTHMNLCMKRIRIMNNISVAFNNKETTDYFNVSEENRFPKDTIIEEFDYIPYQLYGDGFKESFFITHVTEQKSTKITI